MSATEILVRKIDVVGDLTEEDRSAIRSLPIQVVDIRANQDIVREGDRPSRSFLVLDGFASTYNLSGAGKRQIMSIHMAGDIPDLQSLLLTVLDSSISTITPCRVAFITHEALRKLCLAHPHVAANLWRTTLIDAAIFRGWILNIGRREAYNRMAHLLCEVVARLESIGLGNRRSCPFPFTQALLGDCTGITSVHVNRVLQELRADELIVLKGEELSIPDWDRLAEVGEFDPAYLHLTKAAANENPV